MHKHSPFYGTEVDSEQQKSYINQILKKYQKETATEELKEKIYNELMQEKHEGRITIPFTVHLATDPDDLFPPCIKISLDTKV